MSAGAFQRSTYEADAGTIHPIRIQPETLAGAANPAPAGAATSSISAKVSNTNRSIGLKPRMVNLRFTETVPEGYKAQGTVRIPILTPATYNALVVGGTFTYLGVATEIIGKTPERVK